MYQGVVLDAQFSDRHNDVQVSQEIEALITQIKRHQTDETAPRS